MILKIHPLSKFFSSIALPSLHRSRHAQIDSTKRSQCLIKVTQLPYRKGQRHLAQSHLSPNISIMVLAFRLSLVLLTFSIFSSVDVRNAQSQQTIVDKVHGSSTGGPASMKSSNDGTSQHAHRSAPIKTYQGFPPSASSRTSSRDQHPPCPFHGPILQMSAHHSQGQGLDPMSRFLAEGPSEQHALFIRADTGALSTSRGCTCLAALEGGSR